MDVCLVLRRAKNISVIGSQLTYSDCSWAGVDLLGS